MKSTMKKLFVILAVVMSLVAVQAVWAEEGLGPDCSTVVEGKVFDIYDDENAIVVGSATIYGIPLPWVDIEIDDLVVINAHECPETGRLMACELTLGEDTIDLRPRSVPKKAREKRYNRSGQPI